ncbi:HAMP domain-containing sensor histidine kinase [Massilia sp. TS11]|uniref:sensor histidine kinase n=1 Tax=Massilia sp. TS11 TaxID=2908003 RepID=UPI001EDB2A62|nr:HAMP domain-containing sensor histidine kinase [Massilia sp. TS11]MCG2585683.1 HAMP domain-containing histidine kinase [Massilia sp. TS11]
MSKLLSWFRRGALARHLYLRIYLALLAAIAIAAIASAVATHLRYADRPQFSEARANTYADMVAEFLPPPEAPANEQQESLKRWRVVTRTDMSLYAANGELLAQVGRDMPVWQPDGNSGYVPGHPAVFALHLRDGRWLLVRHRLPRGPVLNIGVILAIIALVVGLGAYPVVRRLTRRLEALQTNVETFGSGQLSTRVPVDGNDEVARLAHSFNEAAGRIEDLVGSHKRLLANASHELRSPLARIRMAVALMEGAAPPAIATELNRNIAELDQLIDEILLASRLDANGHEAQAEDDVDLAGLAAEECARVDAALHAEPAAPVRGDARLLRRMVRNLLENAQRYGDASPVRVSVRMVRDQVRLDVCDRGPGVPEDERERIFQPFYRAAGASEAAGGVGLGLALVRQIARRHGGDVVCLANPDGGSCFRVSLPASASPDPAPSGAGPR